jgi:glycerol uptake operon antiterminator
MEIICLCTKFRRIVLQEIYDGELVWVREEGKDRMHQDLWNIVEYCPIIAAIKDQEGLARALESDSKIIFVLYGDVCSIGEIVEQIKGHGKIAIVHIDLVAGLDSKEVSVDYIKKSTKADGIISTKSLIVRRAKEMGLYTILRMFAIDSLAFENIERQQKQVKPDFIEILPGVMPKIIKKICESSEIPIIVGGMISDKEDVMAALSAGAVSISSSNPHVWFLQ